MRYIVIGKSAVLATRSIERIDEGASVHVQVVNVPDNASLTIVGKNYGESFSIISESTELTPMALSDLGEGTFSVVVRWTSLENGETVSHEAYGNPFSISTDDKGKYIIPVPLSSATELERMWQGIADVLDVLLPLADDVRNGADVI